MYRLTILLVFLCILFIQQQVTCVELSFSDEIEERPTRSHSPLLSSLHKSWYKQLNDINESEQHDDLEQLWKRFVSELTSLRQRRRFGNTRYGRSLSSKRK
ncbi:unnamed protein product [Rotaria sp. Silwood1]|nr:unnamed protein product [Rotaria sp. Silwood1]CAF1297157.1 unnamed protein product [Rotaria sp. Silwood1]CAF1300856.1 unnamed protein product [Rotaria sp. Silwood1]CAF3490977.1 unnamed protein product [Rotaria sp. Silwood1]CAF3505757.1 unnamed protein product [Rotaria sp. Silwood1]